MPIIYDTTSDADLLALGARLVAIGFDRFVEADWSSPKSIAEMLSDVEWYGGGKWHPLESDGEARMYRHESQITISPLRAGDR